MKVAIGEKSLTIWNENRKRYRDEGQVWHELGNTLCEMGCDVHFFNPSLTEGYSTVSEYGFDLVHPELGAVVVWDSAYHSMHKTLNHHGELTLNVKNRVLAKEEQIS